MSHRGYFIPPRPEKRLEGQLDARRARIGARGPIRYLMPASADACCPGARLRSPEFVEERRDALDKWMRQCAPPFPIAFLDLR